MPAVLLLFWLVFACVLAPGCTCESARQAPSHNVVPCISQHKRLDHAPPLTTKTVVAGTTPVTYGVTSTGEAALSIPMMVPPGRAGVEPSLAVHYNSNGDDGVLGKGFAISGASAIQRCPKSRAVDGPDAETGQVYYDGRDARCLDGKRLVIVAQNGNTIEYRTFPDDAQIMVIGHFEKGEESSWFEAFLPSGWVVEYGKTAGTRPRARNGAPRAWLAGETRDARGNTMTYGYCFAESDEGFTSEYALDEIRYTGFDGEHGTRAVSFVYGTKDADDVRTIYSAGMAFQNRLRLDEVQTLVDGELVRRYEFAYGQSETTGRTLLQSVQECGVDACKPTTRFQYAKSTTGFEHIATTIAATTSRLASYMLGDFHGDGLDDLLSPDTTALSTPENPITEWSVARNEGHGFAAPKVAFSQEWSVVSTMEGTT